MNDERTQAENKKINHELFLISTTLVIIVAIIRLALNKNILSTAGELAFLAVSLIYGTTLLVYKLTHTIIDERAIKHLYLLSTVFYIAAILASGTVLFLDIFTRANSHYPIIFALTPLSAFYRIARASGEKFISTRHAEMPYKKLKRNMMLTAYLTTLFSLIFIALQIGNIITIQIDIKNNLYEKNHTLAPAIMWIAICAIAITTTWYACLNTLKAKRKIDEANAMMI